MSRTITLACLGVFFLAATAIAVAGETAQPVTTSQAQRKNAIALIRLLNTAEFQYRHATGRFGTFEELARAALLVPQGPTWDVRDLNTRDPQAPIPGFELRIALPTGGAHYQLSLTDSSGSGWGALSDDRGLIYRGEALR